MRERQSRSIAHGRIGRGRRLYLDQIAPQSNPRCHPAGGNQEKRLERMVPLSPTTRKELLKLRAAYKRKDVPGSRGVQAEPFVETRRTFALWESSGQPAATKVPSA